VVGRECGGGSDCVRGRLIKFTLTWETAVTENAVSAPLPIAETGVIGETAFFVEIVGLNKTSIGTDRD
jgi:hypothetical protein